MYGIRVIGLFVVALGVVMARDLSVRQKRDGDIFGQVNNLINQLLGGGGGDNNNNNGNNGNNNNGNTPSPNPNKQGPMQPDGKLQYCDQNPADCSYLNCLAENFQHSEHSNNIKMGGKILTDPQLRHALQNDPMVSQAACDKIGLGSQGCDGFKQFLGLIDKVSPQDGTNPRDPNRGKRSPDAVHVDSNLGLGVGGTNVNSNTNLGVGQQNRPITTTTTSRPTSRSSSRPSNGNGNGSGNGNHHGHGTDYSDYYDHDHGHGGSGHGTGGSGGGSGGGGSGNGGNNNQPAYTPKDCNAILPKDANGNGNNGNNGNSNNGNRNGNNGNSNNGNRNGNNGNGNNMNNNRGH